MKVKFEIRTPAGEAKATDAKLRPILVGVRKIKLDTYVNDEDDTIYWEIEGQIRDILRINRNVLFFDRMMAGALDSWAVKNVLRKNLSKDDEVKLKDMLLNQTKVNIIKEATAEELVDLNKTFWQRMKEKFKKY